VPELTEGLKVLVAEDNLVNQQVAVGLLERWGCRVRVAANGLEALEALEEEVPDLVLMDVQMPEMDGLEATEEIRGDPRFKSVPILALTAHVLPEERQRCEDAGMDDYVPKPFKPGDLRERVEHWARVGRAGPEGDGPEEPGLSGTGGEGPESTEEDFGAVSAEEPPVFLHEFRAAMKEAGIESVVDAAVTAYMEETPERAAALEAAVADGDMQAVQREAHGLKSGSRNIRADGLALLLEELEAAGKEGRKDDVAASLPELRKTLDRVLDYLREQGSSSE
jgi:CheY-like chemotaxis protein/HPt (histidine-containing phosphotransfer) domain-containing protein